MFIAYSVIESGNIVIRSPSGDTDIIVMLIGHLDRISATVYLDNGTGNNRRVLNISSCTISLEIRNAVIGLHAISGNDYVSAFFRKGKKPSGALPAKIQNFLQL